MEKSTRLKLPYIASAQAQKHITHNEAIKKLDILVQMSVKSRTQSAPVANSNEGDGYIIASAATGDWQGKSNQIALWLNGGWTYHAPGIGWCAWIEAEKSLRAWDGTAWMPARGILTQLQDMEHIGVNTTADATNRLAVRSPATLLSHDGAGHQLKLNKAAAGDTLSLLYQSNWSGRAELGLSGSDDLSIKVSGNGTNWHSALCVKRNSGITEFDQPCKLKQYAKANLPDPATTGSAALIYVHDATGGPTPAFSDGGAWRRVTDRSVVN